MTNHMKQASIALCALALAACTGGPFNGPEHAETVATMHPISVDSQVVTLTIDADPSTTDLSDTDRARLRAFVASYMNNGHGPLTITAPSGGAGDFDGQEAASDIRKALHDAGAPWSSLTGATYRTGAQTGQLVMSFTRYVATPSECGVWKGLKERDYRNLRTPNFGCATMNNIAAMVGDPRDLVAPAAEDERDAALAARGVRLYREGEVTASQVDGNIQPNAAGQ